MKTRVIIVGTGGLYYHGLSALSCVLRDAERVMLIDGDVVDEGNAARQWQPKYAGSNKVVAAAGLWRVATGKTPSRVGLFVKGANWTEWPAVESFLAGKMERLIVLALPDNAEARKNVARGVLKLSGMRKDEEVWFVSGGNGLTSGQCWAYLARGGMWVDETWLLRHEDWWEEDRVGDASCEAALGQSVMGNMLTMACVDRCLRTFLEPRGEERWVGVEWYWAMGGGGRRGGEHLTMWEEYRVSEEDVADADEAWSKLEGGEEDDATATTPE